MNGRDASAGLNASLLLDGEDRILEGNRDAEVFLEKPLEEVRKTLLSKANPALYSALKELLAKTRRGRGVEDYALAYKVGKRLMRLNVSMSPYPLEALGTTGTLVTINSTGIRAAPERRAVREEAPPAVPPTEVPAPPQLLDMLPEPAFFLDMDANFVYANPVMCSLMGYPQEEIIGRPLSFFMLKEEAKQALDCLVEAACAAPWRGELEFNRRNGTTAFVMVTVDALKTGSGKPDRLLGIGMDFTTETRLRREREDELKRVWSLLERVGVSLVCFTPDLRVTLLSRSAQELLSTTSDRAIGTPFPDLFPDEERSEIAQLLENAVKGEEVEGVEVRLRRKKEERPLYISVKPAISANGSTREYMAVIREAGGAPSRAEEDEALLKTARRREKLLELAASSPGTEEFLQGFLEGMEAEFGCSAGVVYAIEKGEAALKAHRGLEEEESRPLSVLQLRPGHARLCGMLVKLNVEIHGGVPRKGWDDLYSFIEKADVLLPLFRERRWRSVLVFPLRRKGEAIGAVALADCDPVKVELAEDQAFSAMGESMALALSALAARRKENASSQFQPERRPETSQPELENITVGGEIKDDETGKRDSGGGVIPKLASVPGREHDYFEIAKEVKGREPAPNNLPLWREPREERSVPSSKGIDLPTLLWDLKEYYSRRGRKGEIFLEIEEDLPKLHTDKRLLREALMQLLDNALKYSPPASPVILGVERWGDEILLRIEDQGPGIPAEIVEGIMHRELEEEGSGDRPTIGVTGLFLCRRYVSTMGGDLTVKGKPEEGTTAFIRLRILPFIGEGQ